MVDRSLQWTQRCDRAAVSLQLRDAVSVRDITAAFADIPCFRENVEAIRQLHLRGVAQYIVSDANVVFIHAFLEAHKDLAQCFTGVVSNKAWLQARGEAHQDALQWFENFEPIQNHTDSDSTAAPVPAEPLTAGNGATETAALSHRVLRIAAYHEHSCDICPVNMCKGSILRHDLFGVQTKTPGVVVAHDNGPPHRSTGKDQAACLSAVGDGSIKPTPDDSRSWFPTGSIAYIGDGSGDLCAARALRNCDTLLVRRGFRLDSILQKHAQQQQDGTTGPDAHPQKQLLRPKLEDTSQSTLKCRVLRWHEGADLKDQLLSLLEARKDVEGTLHSHT